MSADLQQLAERLADLYGPYPALVGAVDGTEDDWGDLLAEAAEELGHTDLSDDEWDRFQTLADEVAEPATPMREWLGELEWAFR